DTASLGGGDRQGFDLEHHGHDHRPAVGLLVEEASQGVADRGFQPGPVHVAVPAPARDGLGRPPAHFFDQVLGLAHVDEAAGDDLGPRNDLGGAGPDADDGDQDPVLGQLLAVPQHDLAHIADPEPVHQDRAGGHAGDDLAPLPVEADDIAVTADQHPFPWDP